MVTKKLKPTQLKKTTLKKRAPPFSKELKRALRSLQKILSLLPEVSQAAVLLRKNKTPLENLHAELRIVGAPEMKRINALWRKKTYATDILSFPSPAFFQSQGHLGELVVCWPTLLKQAKEVGNSAPQELDVLLVHGVLHLIGLDHERSPRELKQQAKLEGLILRNLGADAESGLISRLNVSQEV
jgi:rRNA maturation RNase YbeY